MPPARLPASVWRLLLPLRTTASPILRIDASNASNAKRIPMHPTHNAFHAFAPLFFASATHPPRIAAVATYRFVSPPIPMPFTSRLFGQTSVPLPSAQLLPRHLRFFALILPHP